MNLTFKAEDAPEIDHLNTIWAIIEARQSLPALIAVASATEFDDTSQVAHGLARVSHDAGNRTGYLNLGTSRMGNGPGSLPYDDLSVGARFARRGQFDVSLAQWRADYDVVIIEIPKLRSCPLGSHVARLADGTVIALYPGRKVSSADRDLKALFGQLHASVIGVVKTSEAAPVLSESRAHSKSLVSRFFPVRQQ